MEKLYVVLVRENHSWKRIQFKTKSFAEALIIKRALGASTVWGA